MSALITIETKSLGTTRISVTPANLVFDEDGQIVDVELANETILIAAGLIKEKAGVVELKSNHLDCRERKDCAGYRPAPVCQKIHLQGCFQNIKVKP